MAEGESRPTKAPPLSGSDEASEPRASPGLQPGETLPKTESQRASVTSAHGAPVAGEAAARSVMVPRWIQLVALPLLVLAVWMLAVAAGPVLLIFAVAGVLALILNPVVRWIQRARVPRGLAVALVYVGFWAIVATGAVLLANPIGDQIAAFSRNVPTYVDSVDKGLQDLQAWLDDRGIDLQVSSAGDDALSELEQNLLARSEDVVGFTRDVVELLVRGIFALVLVIVISVYMLLYAHTIGDLARRVMPSSRTAEDDFPTRVERSVARYVGGQLAFSAIMGTSAAIALWIFGTVGIFEDGRTFAVFFGLFYGLMELIPYVGPVLGAAPPVLIALFEDPLTAIWLVLLFVALQQLEGHIVAPLVFGRALRINPLLVIFALLFGAHLHGVIGALVALPLVAMLRETVMYLSEHLRLEPWPVATAGRPAGLLHGAPTAPCPVCGEQASADDRYCGQCGAALSGEAAARAGPMSGTQ
jgi:predicted PurR-regulated permease PerM